MKIYDANGHISNESMKAIINEKLDGAQSLDVAEHLSICEKCIDSYTALLTENVLLSPEIPLAGPVFAQIAENKKKVAVQKGEKKNFFFAVTQRYMPVAVAACFMIVFFTNSAHKGFGMANPSGNTFGEQVTGFFSKMSEGFVDVSENIAGVFTGWGQAEPEQAPNEARPINTSEQRKLAELKKQQEKEKHEEWQAEMVLREAEKLNDPLRQPVLEDKAKP